MKITENVSRGQAKSRKHKYVVVELARRHNQKWKIGSMEKCTQIWEPILRVQCLRIRELAWVKVKWL